MKIQLMDNFTIELNKEENLIILNHNSFFIRQLILKDNLLFSCNLSFTTFDFINEEKNLISILCEKEEDYIYIKENINFIVNDNNLINVYTKKYFFILDLLKNIDIQKEEKRIVIDLKEVDITLALIKKINKLANEKNCYMVWFITDAKKNYTTIFNHRIKNPEEIIPFQFRTLNRIEINYTYRRKLKKINLEIDRDLYQGKIKQLDFEKYKIEIDKYNLFKQIENF